ncbi:hypothetical protein BG011_007587 [Mortierella polycephala]|uniref:Copper acquisition factor BIM1-like domain-containing protein n=1 Tax=Mortierella polycephala TaxID=41804 RepID=A0A9P6TXI6_9FUNG|nr:hypothetical protein BG011_007587 [Mortierella polycephala]
MKVLSLASLLLCSSAAMAHYSLDYPPTRGESESKEIVSPCGGFNDVGARIQFPLTRGFVQVNSGHPNSKVDVNIAYGNNPSAADFTAAADKPIASLTIDVPRKACMTVDLTKSQDAVDNTNATIQIVYNDGHDILYQCSDVVLVTSAEGFDLTKCVNEKPTGPTPTVAAAAAAVSVKSAATAVVAVLMAAALAL